jgi:hypothetical protein
MSNSSRRIYRSIEEPIRTGLSWKETWQGPDQGLIWCWERGRQYRQEFPEKAAAAERGELVPDGWRGGVREKLKNVAVKRDGTMQYLATWQGMRGEALNLDIDATYSLVCSRTGQIVEFQSHSLPVETEDI